ncbi:MAG TPA: FUSC family protein, partial [Burkholderiaceae bacterium]|nr:FUSC family protein [Burkholderiaceae bacterium]
GGTRLAGTLLGSAGGFVGAWLHHRGVAVPAVTLTMVATLAFASALVPLFASAPVAALIILSSAAIPGHTALQVAALRGIEVGIGVVTGVAVSWLLRGAGATARFDAACAAMLRHFASGLRGEGPSADDESATRTRLRELAVLAAGADIESRWLHRASRADAKRHRRLAGLMARLFQDVAVLGRLLSHAAANDAAREATRATAQAVLESAAQSLAHGVPFEIREAPGASPALAAPLRLLIGELRAFVTLQTAGARSRTQAGAPAVE